MGYYTVVTRDLGAVGRLEEMGETVLPPLVQIHFGVSTVGLLRSPGPKSITKIPKHGLWPGWSTESL